MVRRVGGFPGQKLRRFHLDGNFLPQTTMVTIQRDFRDFRDFIRGTFAPFFLASDSPIAIACLRLVTLPPRPPLPLRRVPCLLRRIADLTDFCAPLPYRAMGSPRD